MNTTNKFYVKILLLFTLACQVTSGQVNVSFENPVSHARLLINDNGNIYTNEYDDPFINIPPYQSSQSNSAGIPDSYWIWTQTNHSLSWSGNETYPLEITGSIKSEAQINMNPNYYGYFAEEASSGFDLRFSIASGTQYMTLSGLLTASGSQPNISAVYELRRGKDILYSATAENGFFPGSGSVWSNFSRHLSAGEYSLVLNANVSIEHQGYGNALNTQYGMASIENFALLLEDGPALTGNLEEGMFQLGASGGGLGSAGGTQVEFATVASAGMYSGIYQVTSGAELRANRPELYTSEFSEFLAGSAIQLWDLDFSGEHSGLITLVFNYDEFLLARGTVESELAIAHFVNGAWQVEAGVVDEIANTITIQVSSLSPFALKTLVPVPESSTAGILGVFIGGWLLSARRRKMVGEKFCV